MLCCYTAGVVNAGKSFMDAAVASVNRAMREELTKEAFDKEFKLRGVAMTHARQALAYGFKKAFPDRR